MHRMHLAITGCPLRFDTGQPKTVSAVDMDQCNRSTNLLLGLRNSARTDTSLFGRKNGITGMSMLARVCVHTLTPAGIRVFLSARLIPVECMVLIRKAPGDAFHVLAVERADPVFPFGRDESCPVHVGLDFCVALEVQDSG